MENFHNGNKITVAESQTMTKISNKENFIRDQIMDEPEVLGLGKLIPVDREVSNENGSMDLLFMNDDQSVHYNVELQLGNADSSHILKTISYYLSEQRKYPDKKHRAVLIAEDFQGRWGDALRYIGVLMPYIAIKMHAIQVEEIDKPIIHFDIHMDTYRQQEVEDASAEFGSEYWKRDKHRKRAYNAGLILAKKLECPHVLTKHYVGLKVNNKNFYYINTRAQGDHISIDFSINDEMQEMIDAYKVKPVSMKVTSNWMYYKINASEIEKYIPLFEDLYNYKLKENE